VAGASVQLVLGAQRLSSLARPVKRRASGALPALATITSHLVGQVERQEALCRTLTL
jgi:hypothetical protein